QVVRKKCGRSSRPLSPATLESEARSRVWQPARGLTSRSLLRHRRACHRHATALLRSAAIWDWAHDDFDPRLIFVHGARCGVDAKADNAAEYDVAGGHDLVSEASPPTPVVYHCVTQLTATSCLLLGRTTVPGVCTVRVPTAGDESVHMASCTPGVATEACCWVPLTMVEQPVRRITPHKAATPRPMAEPPGRGLSY